MLTSTKLKLAYVGLAAVDTWLSGITDRRAHRARFVTKPLLMPTLTASLLTNPRAADSPLRASTVAAQLGGWGGDVALLGEGTKPFLAGTGSFALGHAALKGARAEECLPGEAVAELCMSTAYLKARDFADAVRHGERAIDRARRVRWEDGEASAHHNMALACWSLGRLREALAHGETALAMNRDGGRTRAVSVNLGALGVVRGDMGELEAERLLQLEAEWEGARLLTLQAAWMADNRQPNSLEASMAKAKAGRVGSEITLGCVELASTLGYSETELLEKWSRDSKILDIFEGTQQIQQLIVARRVLGLSSAELK